MNKYFVSYSHSSGFGCTVVKTNYDIDSYDNILEIIDKLQKNDTAKNIIILNIQRLPI